MKRIYSEIITKVGKPLLIQRYEYHFTEEENLADVISQIRSEHGNVSIANGRPRVLEVTYVKEYHGNSNTIDTSSDTDICYEKEEDIELYGTTKQNRRKRKHRI